MKTGYFDSNNKEYEIGDIVLNPYFNDLWIVDMWSNVTDFICEDDTDYCFVLWGNAKCHYMDILEPEGFTIIARKSEDENKYNELLEVCDKASKTMLDEI